MLSGKTDPKAEKMPRSRAEGALEKVRKNPGQPSRSHLSSTFQCNPLRVTTGVDLLIEIKIVSLKKAGPCKTAKFLKMS